MKGMRWLVLILVLVVAIAGGAYLYAGRLPGPTITITQPDRFMGRATPVDIVIEAPGGSLSALEVAVRQGERLQTVSTLSAQGPLTLTQEDASRIRLTGSLGAEAIPELTEGQASIEVSATRPVLFDLRTATSVATRDVEVRLTPPRLSVLSSFHYVNLGGAELIVYRVTPDVERTGVRVGELRYPGYAVAGGDAGVKAAFFALRYDQDLNAPLSLYAEDPAGNTATIPFDHRVFPQTFRRSRIDVPDSFLERVVPAILDQVPDMRAEDEGDLLGAYLRINGELRDRNAATLVDLAARTAPEMLWRGPFRQLTNSQVESGFADYRTYYHGDQEIDQQVHLGFDLAVTANVPIEAANRGTVVYADYLGIYGNCVVLDHGMGLQSLYAHLSSIEVGEGDQVELGQVIGRSGMTGLAGGDHLHFTMLLQGHAINPVEWWSPQWIEDRVLRKLREVGAAPPVAAGP